MEFKLPIYAREIQKYLPHRYPFILIDRIIEFTPYKSMKIIKNVSMNEPYFDGHFPSYPVVPGVLLIETLAQAGGLLAKLSNESDPTSNDNLYLFVGINNARFKKQVIPGDQLICNVELIKDKSGVVKFLGVGTVDGQVALQAELMCARTKLESE